MRVTPPYEDHSVLPRPPGGSENPTTALYKAALGPVNTAHYLAVFERFDTAGRPGLVWNPAAGLLTLNWMAFRRLWLPALVYLAGAQGLALMVLGLSRQVLDWPLGVELGVLGTLLLLSIALPGLYGNALLHADIRRRMATAVTNAHTVREACETLEQQAPSRKRLQAFMAVNALMVFLALAMGSFALFRPAPDSLALPASAPVSDAASEPAPVPAASPSVQAVAGEAAPATSPVPVLAGERVAPAEKPAELAPPPPAAVPAVLAPPPGVVGVAGGRSEPVPAAAPAPSATGPTSAPAAPAASAGSSPAVPATEPAQSKTPPPAKSPPDAPSRSAASAAKPPAAAQTPQATDRSSAAPAPHAINVGLFAEEANAVKVHTQLIEAGLPATMKTVEGTRGPRTRVRAGPFPDRAAAEAAAQRIRSLGLEAQIFRQ